MKEKKLTGYPSIDKPWLKYYRTTPVREIDKDQTIYELVFNSNKDNMEDPALAYLGVNWTYAKLRAETDRAADAFAKAGLIMGDVVLLGVSNCFEAVVSLLALNKQGVISKWFDIRASQKDIMDYANDSNCKMLIAFDMLLPKVEPILNQTSLQKVLVIRPSDSLSKLNQLAYYLKCKIGGKYVPIPSDSCYLRFSDFVKGGQTQSAVPCVPFDRNRPSVMIQSSGTTGKPKIIVHSDYSATACTYSLAYCDTPLGRGKVFLNLLPPWIAYALGEAILYPLGLGSKVVLSPTFEPEELPKYIGKFTAAFAAPFHYRYLYDHIDELTAKKKQALYKVDCFVSGGDKMSVEENAKFEDAFQTVLMNGYGNNEGWGCLTNNSLHHNRYGTVGIPKYGETVIAYDEIADIYQFGTENGVLKNYHRTLDKMRTALDKKGLFYSVRLKRVRKSAGELIYEYTPMNLGAPGVIDFDVRKGVIHPDYLITETAELDFSQSKRIGHAAARLLLRLARENNLPADRVFPLPYGSVGQNK